MTEIAYVEDGAVTRFPINIKQEFPNTSFPKVLTKEMLPDEYYPVAMALPLTLPNLPGLIGERPYKRKVVKPFSEWTVGEFNVTKTYSYVYDDVEMYKKKIIIQIDQDAETERLKYITPGAGQSLTYQQKIAEANAYIIDSNPTPEKYPMIYTEIGITGPDAYSVSIVIIESFNLWQQVGAAIEGVRLYAKKLVAESLDNETTYNVYKNIVWPNPTM